MSTRIVLTDVTVTDAKGNPVHGLTRSDFHIFDDNHAQTLSSFVEHTQSPTATPIAAPASSSFVSNNFLLHPPEPVNVLLIDTTTIHLIDQMYVYQQLTRFVNSLPPGEPIAIYNRSGDTTLLLQNFTSDHALLLAAIRRAVPHFRSPGAWYTSDLDTLQQMAAYLQQIPGRKNLLWFSSGSNLFLQPDPTDLAFQPDRAPIYDLLEAERIAIYPIDARGLTVGLRPYMLYQQMQMEQDAQVTGGIAFYNNNGLAQIASRIISNDSSYYTLTYAPQGLRRNGKWHRVKVTLDNPHDHLSYRRGYYDDGQNTLPPPGKTRTMLRADGSSTQVPTNPGEPIIFQARVLPASVSPLSNAHRSGAPPAPPKKGQTAYTIRYSLAASTLQPTSANGNVDIDKVRSAIIAFDHFGSPIARVLEAATFDIPQDELRSQPNAVLDFDQQINLPSGEDNLYIVVWDTTTGRFGTVSLSLDVTKPPRPKS
jgi:VWFA-related protein